MLLGSPTNLAIHLPYMKVATTLLTLLILFSAAGTPVIYPSKDSGQSSVSDATSRPTKDQSSATPSEDSTLSGDTLPTMTGTDKTTVEPGIPTMQPSSSSISGTWSDSFMPTKDKTSTFAPSTSSTPAKDQSSYSVPAKDQSSTSVAAKDQSSSSMQTKDETSTSVPTKDQTSTSVAAKDIPSSAIPAKDQSSTSVPAKDQGSSSMAAKDQTSTSMPSKDQTSTSMAAKDQTSSSLPSKDQASHSTTTKDQTSISVPAKDQTTSSSVSAKDLTPSTSNQVYSFSIPTSNPDDQISSKLETPMSSGESYKSENGLTSSTVPSVVIYSFTLPPSSVLGSGVSSKPEISPSVVVSSFTVPSVIYSFTLPSSTPGMPTSIPIMGPSPTKSEVSSPTTKSEQPPGGKDSSSTVNAPYLNTTSSVVPLWTPDMLGNAYGGGFINTPSIYVTLGPQPTAAGTGVPPGYGVSIKPETSPSTDKLNSLGSASEIMSTDKTNSGGSSTTQTIALSGSGLPYTTDQYGIPSSGVLSETRSTDCCGTSTTLSVGRIDNSGTPVSIPVGGISTPGSAPTSYTFGKILPTPITTAPYGGNSSLANGNGSNSSIGGLLNPTALPDYRGFAIKNGIGFTAGLLGILVFVFLI